MTLSLLVPTELAPAVSKRLKKLASSCGVTVTEIPGSTTLIRDKGVLRCARVSVSELPHTNGWRFVARFEHLAAGNVITRGPGEYEADLVTWRTLPPVCSHCKTARRRKETFLLRSPDGELRQIARNCLADFVCGDASRLLRAAELAADLEGCMSEERWGSYRWSTAPVAFIACAVAAIARSGFRKSTEEGSTKNDAEFASGPRPGHPTARALWDEAQPTEAHVAQAEAVIAWLGDHEASGSSEYIWNLRLSITEPDVGKHAGLLASAPVAHQRYLGREVTKKIEKKQPEGPVKGYAAAVKEIFEGEATLVRASEIASNFGRKVICTFRSASGHELVWFSTGRAPQDLGMRYTLKGRVKKHESCRGVDQTVLQRVTYKQVEEAQ